MPEANPIATVNADPNVTSGWEDRIDILGSRRATILVVFEWPLVYWSQDQINEWKETIEIFFVHVPLEASVSQLGCRFLAAAG